jgi:hypothetical protein
MMYIVRELPEHVELSEHLKNQAEFYICVQSFGISYYIPATPKIRRLVGLDAKGNDAENDRRRKCRNIKRPTRSGTSWSRWSFKSATWSWPG